MSKHKWLPVTMMTALIATIVGAESNRTFYSLENRLPRWEQLEVGVEYHGSTLETGPFDVDTSEATVYGRYGLLDDLAVRVDLPYVQNDPDFGDSESGIGDMDLQFQLRTYEDIFGYPYFIPYVTVTLPTGDEDKGLGAGDATVTVGISYGSTINDWIDWVLDVSYRINSDLENQIIVGHSYVWNVSDDFGLLTEFYFEQAELDVLDDTAIVSAGFSYEWTQSLDIGLSFGYGVEGPTEAEGQFRVAYNF